jgi:iron complex transport system substrate-binding protein
MKKQIYRLVNLVFLITFSCIVAIIACDRPIAEKTAANLVASSSECRTIQYKLGESCIPAEPQRIVALDPRYILDPLLALGIRPVGFSSYVEPGRIYTPGLLSSEIAGIESVGHTEQPSLEKIAVLNPDLILALDIQNEQNYKQLSAIANTVFTDYEKIKFSFKENFRFIAQLLAQEEKAEEVLNQYQVRINEIRDQLGSRLREIEISVILQHHGGFWMISKESGISQVLTDIGLHHKTALSSGSQLSIEVIGNYDADILFIMNGDSRSTSYFLENPLISSLKAVKNKRAYVVDPNIWWAYGPIGINRLLDDLSKYLFKIPM